MALWVICFVALTFGQELPAHLSFLDSGKGSDSRLLKNCEDNNVGLIRLARRFGLSTSGCADVRHLCSHPRAQRTAQRFCPVTCGLCEEPAPTNDPTADPTVVPTSSPTQSPTLVPTDVPTSSPTLVPTQSPTDVPTYSPTDVPTLSPTQVPTDVPTSSPTQSPTLVPTDNPTSSPTQVPTDMPTSSPTQSPTLVPTQFPTIDPTSDPTVLPLIRNEGEGCISACYDSALGKWATCPDHCGRCGICCRQGASNQLEDCGSAGGTGGHVCTLNPSCSTLGDDDSTVCVRQSTVMCDLHACVALKNDGSAVAWGYSSGGGDASSVDLTNVANAMCGRYACVALKHDGRAVAWGDSSHGGDASSVDLTNVASAMCGDYACVAVKSDGRAVAWGDSSHGGDASTVDLTNVADAVCGGLACVALKHDGRAVAWGISGYGGDASSVDLTNVANAMCGGYACVALRNDGSAVAWGRSSHGGDASSVDLMSIAISTCPDVGTWIDDQKCPYGQLDVAFRNYDTGVAIDGINSLDDARNQCADACVNFGPSCHYADLYYISPLSMACYLRDENCGDFASNYNPHYQVWVRHQLGRRKL